MNFLNISKLVFVSLVARKGRSFLTMLGIVIGVAGVIIIIALGAGAQSLILGQITKLGSNLLSVQPGKSNEKGPPAQVFGVVITTLIKEDAVAIRNNKNTPYIKAVNSVVRGGITAVWQNKTIDTNFTATDSYYPQVIDFNMKSGRFFTEEEDSGSANVVVLGSYVAEQLFKDSGMDPVGQIIKIKNSSIAESGFIALRVIGVILPRGSAFFQDNDDQIFLPLNIGQKQILGISYLQAINIKVDSSENVLKTKEDVTNLLKQRHKILKDSDIDFTVRNIADAVEVLSTITNALSIFLTAMASVSLVVGGIGILNIMLATVAERTREIGLRKAVGASNMAIMRQFLLEAGILTFFGGIIGIIIGIIISYLVSLLMNYLGYDWAFVVSISSVLLAIGVSILTGVIFGLYPALKASRLNPIDALRYE